MSSSAHFRVFEQTSAECETQPEKLVRHSSHPGAKQSCVVVGSGWDPFDIWRPNFWYVFPHFSGPYLTPSPFRIVPTGRGNAVFSHTFPPSHRKTRHPCILNPPLFIGNRGRGKRGGGVGGGGGGGGGRGEAQVLRGCLRGGGVGGGC